MPAEQPRPTWGELVFTKDPIPLDESLQKVSRDATLKGAQAGSGEVLKATGKLAPATAPVWPL